MSSGERAAAGFGGVASSESGEESAGTSSPSFSAQSGTRSVSPDSSPVVHVVSHCDPDDTEPDVLIDTEALHQRYRFFEEFSEPVKEPRRFIMTPPRDVKQEQQRTPSPEPHHDPNVVRSCDVVDDIPKTDTAKKMLNVFKRLESQSEVDRPEPKLSADDVPVEPEMARSLRAKFENWTSDAERDNNNKPHAAALCDSPNNSEAPLLDTTKKMLHMFKQLESQTSNKSERPEPKPLKKITPPRDLDVPVREAPVVSEANGHHHDHDHEPEIVRSSTKSEDVIPVEPEMARSLRAKFEKWATDVERDNNNKSHNGAYDLPNDFTPQMETAKNLKAKFESFRCDSSSKPVIEKRKPRVNRFVEESQSELCSICGKILYALEKVEFGGAKMDKIHKSCFKCTHCQSSLRLDNYTLAAGKFYCLTHFKQLFMAKGNYDEGFGREQHKEKWNSRSSNQTPDDGIESSPIADAEVLSVS